MDSKTFREGKQLLMMTYKNLDESTLTILLDRMKAKGFTNQRFLDSVNWAIENHKFPDIKPAHILAHDKVLNLRTYKQVNEESKGFGQSIWEYYKTVDIDGTCYYVAEAELKRYGTDLPEYKPKPTTSKRIQHPRATLSQDFSFTKEFDKIIKNSS
ncbi:MAG: hypothetical protein GY936_14315 [Ignavibacteriae bacterium]|nr:hypothetical protein [Ignavibacteriota bacterium]